MTTPEPGLHDYPFAGEPPQPPQPPRKRWYQRWPAWIGIGAIALIITALIVGLAGGGGSKPAAQPINPPVSSLPTAEASPPTDEASPPADEPSTDDTTTSPTSEPSLPDCAGFVGKPVKLILNPSDPTGTPKCSIPDYGGNPQQVFVERRTTCTDGTPVYAFYTLGIDGGDDSYIGAANGVLRKETINESGDIHAACGKNAPPQGTTYQVSTDGSGFSSITYFASSGEAQDTDVAGSSWSKNFPDGVQTPIVSAQGNGSGSYIACNILKDGQVTKSNRSSGPYAVVSCD
jgi:hypothetical protein